MEIILCDLYNEMKSYMKIIDYKWLTCERNLSKYLGLHRFICRSDVTSSLVLTFGWRIN